jgi:transcriptional regulator with XRE-family HTH domain
MDRLRLGRSVRALRIEAGWRQVDLAARSACSRTVISRIERGDVTGSTIGVLAAICAALSADLDVRIRWRGEGLDRLLDERHAGVVDQFVRLLGQAGWDAAVEVTFNERGERGSVDVVGWMPAARALLIVEIKSVVPDAQATLVALDRKARLGPSIGRTLGWDPLDVSKVLGVSVGSTNRRRVPDFEAMFRAALPLRGLALRRWLRDPSSPVAALMFLPDSRQKSTRRGARSWLRTVRPSRGPSPSQRPPGGH